MRDNDLDIPQDPRATVLVVDDYSTNRLKIAASVRSLGYAAKSVASGSEALAYVRTAPCDAILLDIVMPEMDGFEVLAALKADETLRDIPVIVISALDEQTENVVRAIEAGAEDFLPKDYDPVILRARLGASLEKKRFRDAEREFRDAVSKLTMAAETLEAGAFQPQQLDIAAVAERSDPLGRLARVFQGMAQEIYDRELRLRRNVRMLNGTLLVIAVGGVWGIIPALSRMAPESGSNPIGLAVMINLVAAALCLTVAIYRRSLPRFSWPLFRFYACWAFLVGICESLVLFWATEHVQASTVALIVTLEGFVVFGFASAIGLEKASLKRLAGLAIGLCGAIFVVLNRASGIGGDPLFWLLIATAIPVIYAMGDILQAVYRPGKLDIFASVGVVRGLSVLMLMPIALATGSLDGIGSGFGRLEVIYLLIGAATAGASVLMYLLITTAGAVYASQAAYSSTIAGIVWSMLLLDESLSITAWAALAVMIAGLMLVEPTSSPDDLNISLPTRVGRRRR